MSMLIRAEVGPSHAQSLASKVTFSKEPPETITKKEAKPPTQDPPKGDKNKEDLGFDLQTFWAVDRSGINDDPTRYDKMDLVEEFEKGITREEEEGRYCAPFRGKKTNFLWKTIST